jgi:hypothetical protein
MGNAPRRDRNVYFVGAGLSCAFGLPNTAALLTELTNNDALRRSLTKEVLKPAYEAFYPDGSKAHYLPDTVDFFSSLQAFIDIGAPGLPGTRLKDAAELLRSLKLGITQLLVTRIKEAEASGRLTPPRSDFLDEMIQPGAVFITTNWDLLIERYAHLRDVDIRRTGGPASSHLLLLKLHGSVDWCQWSDRREKSMDLTDDFAILREVKNRLPLPPADATEIVRVRALEHWARCWQRISGRTDEPFLVTMYRGKGPELKSLTAVWEDAYNALSRAKALNIIGYSLPSDDLEIRTLLRAGIQRGKQRVNVTVRNPAPDVHARIRAQVTHLITSDYSPV